VLVSGSAVGVKRRGFFFSIRSAPETLQDILRSLVATGQVEVLKVGGEMVYRAAG